MKKNHTATASQPLSARFRPDPEKRLEFIPGKMIVKIKESSLRSAAGALRSGGARLSARLNKELPESVTGPLDYLRANAGLKRTSALFVQDGKYKAQRANAARVAAVSSVADSPHEDLRGFTVVSVDPKSVNQKVMRMLRHSSAIQYVEPMPARWIARRTPRTAKAATSDPMQKLQWGLRAIGWFDTKHPAPSKIARVKVAVLDTGIDQSHEDLGAAVQSYDHHGRSAEDIVGHGTHVAGIIATVTNNSVGISGLAPCPLAIWKISDDQPIGDDFYVDGELYLRALGLLADEGCKIVNLSIGGTQQSRTEALLFRRLRERDVLPIAAMGNEFEVGNPVEFPAAYPGVVAVGAISSELRRASFSNTGPHIWVVAPGHTILSTVPMDSSPHRPESEYATWSGTSMAAPHVAACAALYRAANPSASANQVEAALSKGTKRLPQMGKRSFTTAHGHGLVYLPKLL